MRENFEKLSLAELYDLLKMKSEDLLTAIHEKEDGYTLRDLRADIETIKELIKSKEREVK